MIKERPNGKKRAVDCEKKTSKDTNRSSKPFLDENKRGPKIDRGGTIFWRLRIIIPQGGHSGKDLGATWGKNQEKKGGATRIFRAKPGRR